MRTAWSNLVQVRHQMILLSFPKIPEDIRDFSGSSRIKDSEKSSCRCGLQITISVKPLPTFFFLRETNLPIVHTVSIWRIRQDEIQSPSYISSTRL